MIILARERAVRRTVAWRWVGLVWASLCVAAACAHGAQAPWDPDRVPKGMTSEDAHKFYDSRWLPSRATGPASRTI